jgi:hypothetical protein
MTIGYWHAQAQAALRASAQALSGHRASSPAEANALIAARSTVYGQLARVTELLVGGRPVPEAPTRASASLILGRHGQGLTRLYVGLQAAALVDQQYPPSPANAGSASISLRQAADAIGVIGDILASHVAPHERPRTPEGAAIRAGGGVQAALADVARLTIAALTVDNRLPTWLNRGPGPLTAVHRPVMDAARWASGSRLGAVARDLIAAAAGQPALIDELDVALQPLDPAPAVTTADDAIAAVTAARTWLWQHPDQAAVVHLQLGTQLGLAVHALSNDTDPAPLQHWREAAIAAADLRGTPALDVARSAAGELAEVLRWARVQLNPTDHGPTDERLRQLGRLAEHLPTLASTLYRGARHGVQRRDLFVRDAVLRRPSGSLIYRTTQRWRPALSTDDAVRTLNRHLSQLHRQQQVPAGGDGTRPAVANAFPGPPRPSSAAASPGPSAPPSQSARHRGPAR